MRTEVWLTLVGVLVAGDARGESPVVDRDLVFVAGPDFIMEAGVRSALSLGRIAFGYDAALSSGFDIDESVPLGKAAGVGGRIAKLFFLDAPLAGLELVAIHELFGHGSVARELDLEVEYFFRLPRPYSWLLGDSTSVQGFVVADASRFLDDELAFSAAGFESQEVTLSWIRRTVAQNGGRAHYSDLLVYGMNRINYALIAAGDQLQGDLVGYTVELQARFNLLAPADRDAIVHRIRLASLWALADPALWLAAYYGAFEYLWNGERQVRFPFITVGSVDVFPSVRLSLTPFGAEQYLDVFVIHDGIVLDVYGRLGTSGLASYYGGGAHLLGYRPGFGFELGAAIDVWTQPLLVTSQRNVFSRDNAVGGSAGVYVTLHLFDQVAATGKLAFKSRGYLMGQPLGSGAYGYVGLVLTANRS